MMFDELTIVTSCHKYGQYLADWANSIAQQSVFPGHVIILTHGLPLDAVKAKDAVARLTRAGVRAEHTHSLQTLDFGVARNRVVNLAKTEWVMHLDADDMLTPVAIEDFKALAPDADVISAGYERTGHLASGPEKRARLYTSADGEDALRLPSMCSGVSPFRKSFWERCPYREDMFGAWDTALWIGFARLGARFRATSRASFFYRQHADSVFNTRRKILGWARVHTTAMLRNVRAQRTGVDIIIPRSMSCTADRDVAFNRVVAHYTTHHPDWNIITGKCPWQTWVKGAAINDALKKSNADVLILADADCLVDPVALEKSVEQVQKGAPWAMPHLEVYRVAKDMNQLYLSGDPSLPIITPDSHSTERAPYEGCPGGGIVVLRRVSYDAIGGIPFAFRGWGSEDRALATLCDTLLGPCMRGDADLLHLWHIPQVDRAQPNSNLQLLRRLGLAAYKGKDALVATAYTMPNPGDGPVRPDSRWKTNHGTARPASVSMPIDVNRITQRQAAHRLKRSK